ncbi:alpha-galactosidase precursor [Apiospora kogelbergensis]|uniref:alpha-galactosidase precursor n=1 Tax=Apiospora kogelbergensis TaxID=1337665 RepID=UPI0031314ECA
MGWNSWNEYACDISDDVFVQVADLVVNLGLRELGYKYVNIDDCWSTKGTTRDNSTQRIIPDPNKFPQGIRHVADEIHARGLKLGIYGDADLKYDNCNIPQEWVDVPYMYPDNGGTPNGNVPPGYDWSTSNSSTRYNRMRNALLAQNRTIQYSLCIWGHANVVSWGNATGHSWRMFSDIYPAWTGTYQYSQALMPILNQAAFYANSATATSPWRKTAATSPSGPRSSPLIIGTKLDAILPEILAILKNEELIAFNQDAVYGAGAIPYRWDGVGNETHPADYWAGSSSRGVHAFVLNTEDEEREMELVFDEIPGLREATGAGSGPYLVHDMWTGEDLGVFASAVMLRVKRHDTAAVRINTADGEFVTSDFGRVFAYLY